MHLPCPDRRFPPAATRTFAGSSVTALVLAFFLSTGFVRAAGPPESHARADSAPAAVQGANPAAPRSGLSRDDLFEMLGARIGSGVIALQVKRAGLAFAPETADLVSLKKAGASDDLLEGLLAAPVWPAPGVGPVEPADPAAGARTSGTRVFESTDARGRTVLVITNLDESGQRLNAADLAEILPTIVKAAFEPAPRDQVAEGTSPDDRVRGEYGEDAGATANRPLVQVIQNAAPEKAEPAPQPAPVWPAAYVNPPNTLNGCAFGGCNVISTGGTVGAYRYPDRLWFLGYKP